MADYQGTDAIYVVNYELGNGGLPIVGHSLLFIEYDNVWYSTDFSGPIFNPSEARIHVNFADVNMINKMKKDKSIKNIDYVYIQGDFSKSLDLARSYQNTNYGGYDLIKNNCLHYVQELLKAGKFDNNEFEDVIKSTPSIIPAEYYITLSFYSVISSVTQALTRYAQSQ